MNKKSGFTLIELLATIAILAVLAVLVVPSASNYTERANAANLFREIQLFNAQMALRNGAQPFFPELPYPGNWNELYESITDASHPTGIYMTFNEDESLFAQAMKGNETTSPIFIGDYGYVWSY